jgi:hypothetical protein
MNKMTRVLPALALLLMSACSSAPETKSAAPVARARGAGANLKIVWAIEGVDAAKREITLRGPAGKAATFKVGPDVKRLAELHAGDTILADYTVSAVAELREPTAEEEKAPLVLAEMLNRNPANLAPGGTLARTLRIVITIEALNATAGTVTLKGPLEGVVIAKVDDAAVIPTLRVGQKVVVTFDETMNLSVDPGTKKQ